MKKILSSGVLFLVALCHLDAAFSASTSDVEGTQFALSAHALADAGILTGYADHQVRPFSVLSRAEAVKVIVSAREDRKSEVDWYRSHPSPLPLFTDIQTRAWYTPYLEVAFRHGIITGYPDGTFRPTATVATSEAIAVIMRGMEMPSQSSTTLLTSPVIDNVADQWFTPFVNAAIQRNMLMRDTHLALTQPVLRGQFFDMVYRMRIVRSTGALAYAGEEPSAQAVLSPVATGQAVQTISIAQDPASASYASAKKFAITIPSLGIKELTVAHPSDPFTQKGVLQPLVYGVGHLFSYPGQGSKIMIYGHSSGYPWDTSKYTKIFRTINKLAVGDMIYLTYNDTLYVYQVSKKNTIPAKDNSAFQPDGKEELILYTCWPPDSITQRYLVHAVPVKTLALK